MSTVRNTSQTITSTIVDIFKELIDIIQNDMDNNSNNNIKDFLRKINVVKYKINDDEPIVIQNKQHTLIKTINIDNFTIVYYILANSSNIDFVLNSITKYIKNYIVYNDTKEKMSKLLKQSINMSNESKIYFNNLFKKYNIV